MKKQILIIGSALMLSFAGMAQIKVSSSGKVAIGNTGNPTSYGVDHLFTGTKIAFACTTGTITSSALIRGLNTNSTDTTPDFTWYGNDKTGIFHPSANNIGLTINGAQKLNINALGFQSYGYATFLADTGSITSAAYIRGNNGFSTDTTPDYSWYGNDRAGIFHPAANNIGFTIGGSEKMRLNSSGYLGIGDNSPAALLTVGNGDLFQVTSSGYTRTVSGSASSPSFSFTSTTNTGMFSSGSSTLNFSTGGLERMRIDSNGKIGIGTTSPTSTISIGGTGNSSYYSYIYNSSTINGQRGLFVEQESPYSPSDASQAIQGLTFAESGGYLRGVYGYAYTSTPRTSGRTYGLYGYAGNCADGYNYGVYGNLAGSHEGAAIFGGVDNYNGSDVNGTYAGYFEGDVYVTGAISAGDVIDRSDERLKENIELLNEPIDKLLQLVGKKYKLISLPSTTSDTSIVQANINSLGYFKDKTRYGFIAQDVQTIFPDLVYEGQDGYLGLNYLGFIPLLVNAIKQQQTQIETLQQDLSYCCTKSSNKALDINDNGGGKQEAGDNRQLAIGSGGSYLLQNRPNPFSRETVIDYFIASDVTNASIMIFDLNGKLLKTVAVYGTGKGSVTVSSNELIPGMYLYSLVINGNEVDTKKMILSE